MGKNSIKLTATQVGAKSKQKKVFSSATIKTAKVHVGESSYEENMAEESVDITIGVFFDGTLNNKDNTKTRWAYESADKTKRLSQEAQIYKDTIDNVEEGLRGSYENDLSNVARMEAAYQINQQGKILQDKVYVEGIGSVTYGADDKDGMGLGTGPTGIPKKVEKGCIDAAQKVFQLFDKSKKDKINTLQIDVFGFSRGAAAARNFVHEISKKKGEIKEIVYIYIGNGEREEKIICYENDFGKLGEELNTKGINQIRRMVIRFVGLYETVASYGIFHFNDTRELKLNYLGRSKHVFQLVAQDEHRENFVITNIKSAGGNGVEKFIPGVHSDIGGGYTDNAKETNLVLYEAEYFTWNDRKKAERIRDFVIEQGWYKPFELTIDANDNLVLNRVVKSKKYSYVPLHIMVEYAMKKKLLFVFKKINRKYPLDETSSDTTIYGITNTTSLAKIKARLDKHIYENEPPMDWNNEADNKMLRVIRANYVHTSAHYSNKISIAGIMYPPMKPHDSYLTRNREENNG